MVSYSLLKLLDQKPRLFQKAARSWRHDDKLQSLQRQTPAAMRSLILSLLEAINVRCSLDDDPKDPGYLAHDLFGQVVFQIRFVHCPRGPIGLRYLQNLVGSMESVRRHNVIFVLTFDADKNMTSYYTKNAASYIKTSRNYEFLDSSRLVKKVYLIS